MRSTSHTSRKKVEPIGDLGLVFAQDATGRLYIVPGAAALFDVSDRWARLLGQIDLARVLGAALTSANPVISGTFDAAGNRMPSMDAVVRPGYVDVIDRAARLAGTVSPVAASVWDISDRAARLLGTVSPVAASIWDVSDRAARLLGVIYGDVGSLRQNAARSTYTIEETPTAILNGQVTLTGAAQNFPAGACLSVTIENPTANAVVAVGNSNAVTLLNGYRLWPGASISMNIDNLNRIWVIGTVAEVISYIGVN